ncbi:MAG TPA: wax ester/triacylglycerol synthase domain-containing protein [Mycobacterium sp.]|nr:wax ester/triacylglycerol synthase domain-containing protein [Mycobacterium sp.]
MTGGIFTAVRSSAVDGLRLLMEKSTTQAPTVSFIVIEPTDHTSHERLQQWVGSSLPQLTRFRSRLVDRPLGVGPPFWTEIDRYDPSSQIHRATLQAPGGPREFADLIAHLSAGSRQQREMLWEAWSIDGLSGGRWALALRLSPVLSERGVGAAAIWSRLLNADPRGSDDQPRQPGPGKPAVGELVAEVISELVEFQFKGLYLVAETISGLLHVVGRQLGGTNPVDEHDSLPPAVSSMRGPVPRNAFSAPLTDRRAVAFASIWHADLETVSTAFGGDATNVLLAACTLSMRAWLQRYDVVPDDPLAMWMPLAQSGAAPADDREFPIAGQIRIPVQLVDPVEILTNLHTATERMNTAHSHDDDKEHFTGNAAAITSLIPSSLLHAGMRIIKQLDVRQQLTPIAHGSVSPDAGQSSPAYCAGAKVVGMQTVTPLLEGCGLTITPTTHGDQMHLSVCVCPDNVPGVDDIATGIVDALDVLVAAARKSPRGQGRSVVSEMTTHTSKRRQARGY